MIEVYLIERSTMGGAEMLPEAYADKKTARIEATERSAQEGEFVAFKVVPKEARLISEGEVIVDRTLYTLSRLTAKEKLRIVALAKLTQEERDALDG